MVISPIGFVLIMQALKQVFGRLWQFGSVVCGNLPTRHLVKQTSADQLLCSLSTAFNTPKKLLFADLGTIRY